jgi:hypothetical protein
MLCGSSRAMLHFTRPSRRSPAWLPCPPGRQRHLPVVPGRGARAEGRLSPHIVRCAPRPILQLLFASSLLAPWRCGAPSKLHAGNDELDLLQSSDSSTWNAWGSHSMSAVVCPAPLSSPRYPAPASHARAGFVFSSS